MGIKIDKVIMTSEFQAFRNYDDPSQFSITISGSIPAGGKAFEHEVPYDRTGTIADVYFKKNGNSYKRSVNTLPRLTEYAGSTSAYVYANYTPTSIIVGIFVTNPGSAYTPSSETYDFELKKFDGPITA